MNMPEEVKLLPCPFCGNEPVKELPNRVRCNNGKCFLGQAFLMPTYAEWTSRPPSQPSTEEICAKVREDANSWTPEYRAWLFKRGMAIVNSQHEEQPSPTWVKDAAEEIVSVANSTAHTQEWILNSKFKELVEQIIKRHSVSTC